MESVTEKEHLAWLHWLSLQWNRPDRSDYYLMQIAAILSDKGKTNQFKIEFSDPNVGRGKRKVATQEEIKRVTHNAQIKWLWGVGFGRGNESGNDNNSKDNSKK